MSKHFCGIDPGKWGALAIISAKGAVIRVRDMPQKRDRGAGDYDIPGVAAMIHELRMIPSVAIGLEWPQTRPGEGAQRSRNFGLGLGLLAGCLAAYDTDWRRVDPNEWKGQMGLPGKTHANWKEQGLAVFDVFFPGQQDLIRGPRGGLLDGRMEALLLAHYLRGKTLEGMKGIAALGDDAAMLRLFGGRRRRAPKGPQL